MDAKHKMEAHVPSREARTSSADTHNALARDLEDVSDTLPDSPKSGTTPTLDRFHETDGASWPDWFNFDTAIDHERLPFVASSAEQAYEARPFLSASASAPITWSAEATSTAPERLSQDEPTPQSMLSYMQIFDSNMRPRPRRPRRPKTSRSLVSPRGRGRTSRPCPKHKRGKRKCTCHPAAKAPARSESAVQPSSSSSDGSDDVIGHQGAMFDDDQMVPRSASDQLLIFTCPVVEPFCFFQTFDLAEFSLHCQGHAAGWIANSE